jgi:hypothetical protein
VRFGAVGLSPPRAGVPGVTNVQLARLLDPKRPDLLVCQRNPGHVWAVTISDDPPSWHRLATLLAPAHVEAVDLDGDGHQDLLVADLGVFYPSNDRVGRVVWLRNDGKNHFTPVTLLDGVGRVADVRAADFNGDGKPDLVVAVFGWQTVGEVLYLENRTTDWARPTFKSIVLDARPGAIHVPVGDLNGDGKPDVAALISQGSETIVAFLGKGDGTFTKETLYDAPHPAYGSSGIELVDLNRDGRLDVLYTNGDVLDPPHLLKPYHGVQWLENRGTFPFAHHPVAAMYGATRAVAADADGDGDLDIFAVSFLPPEQYRDRDKRRPDAVVLLEQTAPGRFVRHALETTSCNHFTCVAGDLFGDGRPHLAVGNFFLSSALARGPAVTVWRNGGR